MTDDVFARIARLRRGLADLIESLTPDQLAAQSLCVGWDVRTVAAHLTVLSTTSRLAFARTLALSGGSMDRVADTLARRAAGTLTGPQLADRVRGIADSRAVPPPLGPRAPRTDLLVHDVDIRVPLGLPWDVDPDDAAIALEFLAGSPMWFVPRGRLAGLTLTATDLGRSWGRGVEARGRAIDLVLAVCGRRPGVALLEGEGGELLATRLTSSPQGPPRQP